MTSTSNQVGTEKARVVAEYPYYRADPRNWERDLMLIRDLGIGYVSFYIPWRLHERIRDDQITYDFTGAETGHTDLRRLLSHLQHLDLRALVKPGPFIHGEIRYGGLPDRIVEVGHNRVASGHSAPWLATGFETAASFAPDDGVFLREASIWLRAVRSEVIEPHRHLIDGIQIGNEGVFSDASKPASNPRIERNEVRKPVAYALDWFCSLFGGLGISRYTNLPLPSPEAPRGLAYEWWVRRTLPLAHITDTAGYTSWAGDACRENHALARVWLANQLIPMGCLEENWGHVWSAALHQKPQMALHHSLLALALGSPLASVYTVCTTASSLRSLEPTASGLIAEGLEPRDYSGPYCPAAPLTADGERGSTHRALLRLLAVVRGLNASDRKWRPRQDVHFVVKEAAFPYLWKVADVAVELLTEHGVFPSLAIEDASMSHEAPTVVWDCDAGNSPADIPLRITVHNADRHRQLKPDALDADTILTAAEVAARPSPAAVMRLDWEDTSSEERIVFVFNRSDAPQLVGMPDIRDGDNLPYERVLAPFDAAVLHVRDGRLTREFDQADEAVAG